MHLDLDRHTTILTFLIIQQTHCSLQNNACHTISLLKLDSRIADIFIVMRNHFKTVVNVCLSNNYYLTFKCLMEAVVRL